MFILNLRKWKNLNLNLNVYHAQFYLILVQFPMNCLVNICLQCLEKCVIANFDGIKCNLCEKLFDLTIKKVPISKVYLKICSEINSEKKISCNLHPKKKLKYLNRQKQEFYCSLCILKQNYDQNELINYSESNFFEDIDQIEKKLLNLQKSLSEKFNQKIF